MRVCYAFRCTQIAAYCVADRFCLPRCWLRLPPLPFVPSFAYAAHVRAADAYARYCRYRGCYTAAAYPLIFLPPLPFHAVHFAHRTRTRCTPRCDRLPHSLRYTPLPSHRLPLPLPATHALPLIDRIVCVYYRRTFTRGFYTLPTCLIPLRR